MIFVVDNKDFRLQYMVEVLRRKFDVKLVDELIQFNGSESILVLPIQGIDDKGVIKKTDIILADMIKSVNATVLVVPKKKPDYDKYGIKVIEYLTEDVEIENSFYTLEGALALLIANTTNSIKDNSFLIAGYGKLGQTMAKYLDVLGGDITVYSRNEKDLLHCKINGYNVIDKLEYLDYDIVINTIPAIVFTEGITKTSRIGYYLELASPPYGIDMKAKSYLKISIGSGLPGKFTPKSAGILIGHKILELL